MKSITRNLLLLLVLGTMMVSICNSALISNEYNALTQLWSKIGKDISSMTPDNACDEVSCSQTDPSHITGISIYNNRGAPQGTVLNISDIQPFQSAGYVYVGNVKISSTFLKDINDNMPKVIQFQGYNCGITNIQPGLKYGSLWIENEVMSQNIPLSYFANIDSIHIIGINGSMTYTNDLTGPQAKPEYFSLEADVVPDMTNLKVYIAELYLTNNIVETQYPNFLTWNTSGVYLRLYKTKVMSKKLLFPTQVLSVTGANYVYSHFPAWKGPSSLIDIGQTNVTALEFIFANGFNYNGAIPFTNFPPNFDFQFDQAQLTSFDVNDLKNNSENEFIFSLVGSQQLSTSVTFDPSDPITHSRYFWNPYFYSGSTVNLKLPLNSLTGSVPSYMCNISMDVSSNAFTGALPSCITCFLNDTYIRDRVKNNTWSNFNEDTNVFPKCTTIEVYKVGFYRQVGVFSTYYYIGFEGNDLGIDSKITTDGYNLNWRPYIQNRLYLAPVNPNSIPTFNSGTIKITFTAPNKSFNLDFGNANRTLIDIPIWEEPEVVCADCSYNGSGDGDGNNSASKSVASFIALISIFLTIMLL